MIDTSNFAQGVKLNDACKSWLNEEKVNIESKIFPKQRPTPIEKEYAMQDARLTLKLFKKFIEESVIENRTYTIAGRTIKHFKDFCKEEYGTTLEKLLFLSDDKDYIEEQKELFEQELRKGVRGGICQAYQKGIHEHVNHIDARSMYPTQCIRNLYPCGGLLKDPPSGRYTEILYPIGWYRLKDGKVPCMQWTNKANCERYTYLHTYECGEYVKDFFLDGSFPIWKDEYDIIKQQYEVYNEMIKKRWYIRMNDNVVLKDYVNRLYDGKKNNKGAKRLYYKYLLNALYGKFLSRPDGISMDYIYSEIDREWKRIKVPSVKSTYYLPLGKIESLSSCIFKLSVGFSITKCG